MQFPPLTLAARFTTFPHQLQQRAPDHSPGTKGFILQIGPPRPEHANLLPQATDIRTHRNLSSLLYQRSIIYADRFYLERRQKSTSWGIIFQKFLEDVLTKLKTYLENPFKISVTRIYLFQTHH